MNITLIIIPAVIAFVIFAAFIKKVDILKEFSLGAAEGISTAKSILPTLVLFLTAIGMLRASGVLDMLISLISKPAELIGIPKEVLPLVLLKPFSGGGSFAILEDIFKTYGADSFVGRVASTIAGSTETTFYTIAVYFGTVKITNTRHTAPAALVADITGFILSAFFVRLFLGTT